MESAQELLQLWRSRRSYRVGKIIAVCGIVAASVVVLVDLKFSHPLVLATNIVLLLGCVTSWYLTRRSGSRQHFYWTPMYFGFWVSIFPSVGATGGVMSPLFGVYLALLYVGGVIIQTRIRSRYIALFVILQIPLMYWLQEFLPFSADARPPVIFVIIMHAMGIGTLGACIYALLRTERDLAGQFRDRYVELVNTKQELRREEAANFAKTTFLANVSHELRTPLAAILGYGELLETSKELSAEGNSYLETIHRNSQQLARLVDDLLDLSKIEAGTVEIAKVKMRLSDVLTEILKLTRFISEKKNVPVKIVYRSHVPEYVNSDPNRLRQILLNLVGNALKFTEKGQVTIAVEYDNGIIAISVSDTGRGISEEEEERLFKPFSQGDPSLARRYGGTGLGLSLSQKLANLLGGDLKLARSEFGTGSTFVLSLPIGDVENETLHAQFEESAVEADKKKNDENRLRGVKVLYVDDVPDNQILVQAYLKKVGATMDMASNGIQGIEKALHNDYDVVLMDIQMPVMDGYEAVTRLREKKYDKPILALTAHAMKEDLQRCIDVGCNGRLTKPITSAELIRAIESALGR